jgi:hypothetical protein
MSFTIKQNDRSPAITSTLTAGGAAVDISGTSVKFIMRAPGAGMAKVNAAATIVSGPAGTVSYSWGATDTDTAGLYAAEWEVTFAGGIKRTWPAEDYLYVNVVADLA